MLSRYFIWGLLIVLLLLAGALCYLQSGREVMGTLWVQEHFPSVATWFESLAKHSPTVYQGGWVGHHLADIMWSISFAMIICGIWVNQFSFFNLLLVGMACAIFYEVLQLVGIARGTFDIMDLLYSLGSGLLGTLLAYKLLKKHNIKEQYNESSLNGDNG